MFIGEILFYGSILIVLTIVVSFLKSPWFKGFIGEYTVNSILKKNFGSKHYKLIKDVTLPTNDGGTTQIDHLLISKYGIFIIETKNMSGWIFGGAKQKNWTQKFIKKSFKFQNPHHQNFKHYKVLKEYVKLPTNNFHQLVVFVGDAEFKTDMPLNTIFKNNLVKYINSFDKVLIPENNLFEIVAIIDSKSFKRGYSTNKIHKKNVSKIINKKKTSN
jgi:hypothetical protein